MEKENFVNGIMDSGLNVANFEELDDYVIGLLEMLEVSELERLAGVVRYEPYLKAIKEELNKRGVLS